MSVAYMPMGVTAALSETPVSALRPSFVGLVRGELFKLWKQWTTRVLLGLLVVLTCAPYLLLAIAPNTKDQFNQTPLVQSYSIAEVALTVLRIFGGFALLIMTARAIGLEYQLGTIRVLLARGVGRAQLLTAKLTAVALVALALIVGSAILNSLLYVAQFGLFYGAGDKFSALTADFWSHIGAYFVTALISMVATILLAVCVSVVGRSLAFGLTVAMSWFPADNFAVLALVIVATFTHNEVWNRFPAYFLGPILNQLPSVYVPALLVPVTTPHGQAVGAPIGAFSVGFPPFVTYDATHALTVIAVYCVAFAACAYYLTWRRDVLE